MHNEDLTNRNNDEKEACKTALDRDAQRKKKREEKRQLVKKVKGIDAITVDDDDDVDGYSMKIDAVLSELSDFKDIEKKVTANEETMGKAKVVELKMQLLDRITMPSEEKSKKYQELFDALS